MSPSPFELARSAAYAAAHQVFHQLCPDIDVGAVAASLADSIAANTRERAPNLQAVVRDAAGLGVAGAFHHVRNLGARSQLDLADAAGLDPAVWQRGGLDRYDRGE